jgi:hypothetical protein
MVTESHKLRVPLPGTRVTTLDALLDLQQSMLHAAWVFLIDEVLRDIGIGKFSAEPCEIPCEERAADKQKGEDKNRARRSHTSHFGRDDLNVPIFAVVFHAGSSEVQACVLL